MCVCDSQFIPSSTKIHNVPLALTGCYRLQCRAYVFGFGYCSFVWLPSYTCNWPWALCGSARNATAVVLEGRGNTNPDVSVAIE